MEKEEKPWLWFFSSQSRKVLIEYVYAAFRLLRLKPTTDSIQNRSVVSFLLGKLTGTCAGFQ